MFLIVSRMEIFEKVGRVVCRFFIENLDVSQITLYKDCDSILLSCSFLSTRSVRLLKGDSADWGCVMPRNQSVCRVGLPLRDENPYRIVST